jgi:stage II sporulation protein GA (sporulation sigma-E factor processing peptidase)
MHTADGGYRVCIRYRCCTVQLRGLADTGNSLVDFFTGKPVIVCDAAGFAGIDTDAFPPKGFRLLPIATVSGSGMIPVFQPDEVVIYTEQTGRCQQVDALVGLGERGNGMAIFHPRVLC